MEFVGLKTNSKEYLIKVVLKMIVEHMDRFYELITGQMPRPMAMHEITHPFKQRKLCEVHLNHLFRGSPIHKIETIADSNIFRKLKIMHYILKLSAKNIKKVTFTTTTFFWNVIESAVIFLSTNGSSTTNPHHQRVGVKIKEVSFNGERTYKIEIYFESEIISKDRYHSINKQLMHLFEDEPASFSFADLVRTPGDLLLIDTLFQVLASVGGLCGVEGAEQRNGFNQCIFCMWNLNARPRVQRGYLDIKSNMTANFNFPDQPIIENMLSSPEFIDETLVQSDDTPQRSPSQYFQDDSWDEA